MSPANIPMGHHEALKASDTAAPGSKAAFKVKQECSVYYGQKKASTLPAAFGKTLSFAPCGYLPQQLRSAYGATRSGLTGQGVSVAILSEDNDSTALSDANRWAKDRHFPPFKPGQFLANIASHGVPNGVGDIESALDVESVHGMAPAARVNYVVGNGTITGDRLLDALDTVVTYRIATAVSSSWFEGYMPVPKSMITAWEGVLQRATVEGIGVNFATGDFGDETPLQYPGSDPWITLVGGTSIAVGKHGNALWEAGWESDQAGLSKNGQSWKPAPPGVFSEGSTGGVSKTFPEPFYQQGVASHNIRNGVAMRVVPDISDLGDWNLGYQIGMSIPIGPPQDQVLQPDERRDQPVLADVHRLRGRRDPGPWRHLARVCQPGAVQLRQHADLQRHHREPAGAGGHRGHRVRHRLRPAADPVGHGPVRRHPPPGLRRGLRHRQRARQPRAGVLQVVRIQAEVKPNEAVT